MCGEDRDYGILHDLPGTGFFLNKNPVLPHRVFLLLSDMAPWLLHCCNPRYNPQPPLRGIVTPGSRAFLGVFRC